MKVVTVDEWRQQAYRRGISTGEVRAKQLAFQTASRNLIAAKRVGCWNEMVWLAS